MKKLRNLLLLISLLLFAFSIISEKVIYQRLHDYRRITASAGEQMACLQKESEKCLEQIATKLPQKNSQIGLGENLISFKSSVPWLSIFIYKGDSLLWWSDNTIIPANSNVQPGFRYYKNGWYEFFLTQKETYKIIGVLKIRNQYAFQNRFLSNDYHPDLGICASTELLRDKTENSFEVQGKSKFPLFYLRFNEVEQPGDSNGIIALLYFISYLLFLIAVYYIIASKFGSELKAGLVTLFTVIVTRFLSVYFSFPGSLYGLPLFSPSYYASSFLLNSLGDLLISALLIAYLVSVIYKIFGTRFGSYLSSSHQRFTFISVVIAILLTFLYSVFINFLLAGLIINSRISFNINNVFELDVYSLVGVVIIGILLFSFYLVCDGGVRFIQRARLGIKKVLVLFLVAQIIFLILIFVLRDRFLFNEYGVGAFLLTNFLMFYSGYIRRNMRNIYAFTRYLLIIFGFSIYAAQTISEFNKLREKRIEKCWR
ncbi:MAG: hypothetical protein IPP71_04720 [Bacteroidetes bacterium]|nr:hypothetical protein [Bacteroidota bacterium]